MPGSRHRPRPIRCDQGHRADPTVTPDSFDGHLAFTSSDRVPGALPGIAVRAEVRCVPIVGCRRLEPPVRAHREVFDELRLGSILRLHLYLLWSFRLITTLARQVTIGNLGQSFWQIRPKRGTCWQTGALADWNLTDDPTGGTGTGAARESASRRAASWGGRAGQAPSRGGEYPGRNC